jgi:hypothetical protein
MTKKFMPIFNFKQAKLFLEVINFSTHEKSLEGNMYTHSANPLLCMCLAYELLLMITNKFYSLKNECQTIMNTTMEMAILFIKSVDDENFLTHVMIEKDFSGRDSLRIALELELLELIQSPKVEAIIKRIYNSDFDQEGDLFETSCTYQILFKKNYANEDLESTFRFYRERDVNEIQQNQWMYHIYKESLSARINAVAITGLCFVIIQVVIYV